MFAQSALSKWLPLGPGIETPVVRIPKGIEPPPANLILEASTHRTKAAERAFRIRANGRLRNTDWRYCSHCHGVRRAITHFAFNQAVGYPVCKRAVSRNSNSSRDRRVARLRAILIGVLGDACECCGAREDLTLDHIVPLGGRRKRMERVQEYAAAVSSPGGFQWLCYPCNASKGASETCRLEH